MKTLEAKYEEQKIIHLEKTKKQNEELEDLTNVLNEVKVSLNDRISKYGEEDGKQYAAELKPFGIEETNSGNFGYSSDQLDSDSYSSCSTLTFDRDNEKGHKEGNFKLNKNFRII